MEPLGPSKPGTVPFACNKRHKTTSATRPAEKHSNATSNEQVITPARPNGAISNTTRAALLVIKDTQPLATFSPDLVACAERQALQQIRKWRLGLLQACAGRGRAETMQDLHGCSCS